MVRLVLRRLSSSVSSRRHQKVASDLDRVHQQPPSLPSSLPSSLPAERVRHVSPSRTSTSTSTRSTSTSCVSPPPTVTIARPNEASVARGGLTTEGGGDLSMTSASTAALLASLRRACSKPRAQDAAAVTATVSNPREIKSEEIEEMEEEARTEPSIQIRFGAACKRARQADGVVAPRPPQPAAVRVAVPCSASSSSSFSSESQSQNGHSSGAEVESARGEGEDAPSPPPPPPPPPPAPPAPPAPRAHYTVQPNKRQRQKMMMVMMAMPSDDRSAAASVAPGDQGGAALPWPEINTRGGGYGGGRAHDFTLEEDAEVFFFGHDVETGLPVGTHRQGGLPTPTSSGRGATAGSPRSRRSARRSPTPRRGGASCRTASLPSRSASQRRERNIFISSASCAKQRGVARP